MARQSVIPKISHIIPKELSEDIIINRINELLITLTLNDSKDEKDVGK